MRGEEIQAALLYFGAVSFLWAFAHGFAGIRTLSNQLGNVRHGWLDLLVIASGVALLIWPFVPGTLIEDWDFGERWHIAVLTFLVAWVAGVFGGWLILAILSPVMGRSADDIELGMKFLRLQYPVMIAVVASTIGLWWGTLDQLRY